MSIFRQAVPKLNPIKSCPARLELETDLCTTITKFIRIHDIPRLVTYYQSNGVRKLTIWNLIDHDEELFDSSRAHLKTHLTCTCENAVQIRRDIERDNKMALITPDEYRKHFNDLKAEVSGLSDSELEERVKELEQLIRDLNMEARVAIVERSERSAKKREKIRLLDSEYKVKPVEEEKRAAKPRMSKEERMKEDQIDSFMKGYIKKGMSELDARLKAQDKVAALWGD